LLLLPWPAESRGATHEVWTLSDVRRSLARLQISREQAVRRAYDGADYYFCCVGCAEIFRPDAVVAETIMMGSTEVRDVALVRIAALGSTMSYRGCTNLPTVSNAAQHLRKFTQAIVSKMKFAIAPMMDWSENISLSDG
jgi:hypothetical protein